MAEETTWRVLPEEHHIAFNEAADILMFSCYQNGNPAKVALDLYDALIMAYRIGREEFKTETLIDNVKKKEFKHES